jgi:cytochrome P450
MGPNGPILMVIPGNGIINADGDLWKVQRKAGLRFFSNSQLKSFIDDVLPPLLQDTKQGLDKASKERTVVDMQQTFLELTTRLMGSVAYDVCLSKSCVWRPSC